MNAYSIYWIKEEIAYHYFHKSDILYRFLVAYRNDRNKEHLSLQYHYITNQFPKRDLISHVKKHCLDNGIQVQIEGGTIELYKDHNFVAIHVNHKQIKMYCHSLHCAEQIIFPILRLFHPLLFILSENDHKYGWISPFVKSEQMNQEEILYSLL